MTLNQNITSSLGQQYRRRFLGICAHTPHAGATNCGRSAFASARQVALASNSCQVMQSAKMEHRYGAKTIPSARKKRTPPDACFNFLHLFIYLLCSCLKHRVSLRVRVRVYVCKYAYACVCALVYLGPIFDATPTDNWYRLATETI
jgi:hypothetical protein